MVERALLAPLLRVDVEMRCLLSGSPLFRVMLFDKFRQLSRLSIHSLGKTANGVGQIPNGGELLRARICADDEIQEHRAQQVKDCGEDYDAQQDAMVDHLGRPFICFGPKGF